MGSYVPTTAAEREEMLAAIGVDSLEGLYKAVPQEMLLRSGGLNIPEGLSELEVREAVTAMAEKNKVFKTVLRGAGAYRHFIPSVVRSVTSREELVTCYTPYQAEISQGVLQGTFEFQTMICELTGMDVSNASHYDGATAAAEAIPMCKDRKRTKAYVSACAHPQVIEVMKTYCFASNTELFVVPAKDGRTDLDVLKEALGDDAACFYLQQPNYFGQIEDAKAAGEIVHAAGAKFVMGVNPIACAILPTPRAMGADVAVGVAEPFRHADAVLHALRQVALGDLLLAQRALLHHALVLVQIADVIRAGHRAELAADALGLVDLHGAVGQHMARSGTLSRTPGPCSAGTGPEGSRNRAPACHRPRDPRTARCAALCSRTTRWARCSPSCMPRCTPCRRRTCSNRSRSRNAPLLGPPLVNR